MSENICQRCSKAVYAAEEMLAAGRKWHKVCFKCNLCNKRLDSTNVNSHESTLWCKQCYGMNDWMRIKSILGRRNDVDRMSHIITFTGRKFGPKGYGFGGGEPKNVLKKYDFNRQNLEQVRALCRWTSASIWAIANRQWPTNHPEWMLEEVINQHLFLLLLELAKQIKIETVIKVMITKRWKGKDFFNCLASCSTSLLSSSFFG